MRTKIVTRAAQLAVESAEGRPSHPLPYSEFGAIIRTLWLMLAFAAQPQTYAEPTP